MSIDTIRELVEARPFRPFVLHLADGRNVRVKHPEFVAIAPDGSSVVIFKQTGGVRILDTEWITEFEKAPRRPVKKAS